MEVETVKMICRFELGSLEMPFISLVMFEWKIEDKVLTS